METLNGIHLIDCEKISNAPLREIQDTKEFQTFAEQFGIGMKLNGIVYLINTEIQNEVTTDFEQKLAEFYSLPFDVKRLYSPNVFGLSEYGSWGWNGPTEKLMKESYTVETFDFTSNPRLEEDSLYPKEVSGFKESVLTFRKQYKNLNAKLLRSLGVFLELEDKDFFIQQHRALEENHEKSKCSVRTLYYPKEPHYRENAVELRFPEHQDFGTLSSIYQCRGGGGLQAKLSTGEWVDVPYIPNSFVVFVGRSLEMYSGGNIQAVFHRVAWTDKSKTEDRISFGCFLGPDRDTCVLSQVKENPNWTPAYTKMQPGEIFDEYYKTQTKKAFENSKAKY